MFINEPYELINRELWKSSQASLAPDESLASLTRSVALLAQGWLLRGMAE